MKVFIIIFSMIFLLSGCSAEPSGYEQLSSIEEGKPLSSQSSVNEESTPNPPESSFEEGLSSADESSAFEESSFESAEESGADFTESFVSRLSAAEKTDSIIAVRASGVYADVSLHQKINGVWTSLLSCKGYVGANGVGKASEGSYTTPQGVFKAGKAFGVSPDPGCAKEYTKVDSSHYWVDDVYSQYYNQFVSTDDVEKTWNSAEHIIDYPKAYAYCLDTGYNSECIPGEGSAMFLHCTLYEPTAGCISIPESDMIFILQNINENTLFVIANDEDFFNY